MQMMLVKYLFLFILALSWIVFATFQDIRKREVSNWLNFSLIAFSLIFRLFYSLEIKDYSFFLYGIFGVSIMVGFAYLFYYTKVFAGGDAKLLMGIGGILPHTSFYGVIGTCLFFVIMLFFVGSIYSLIYSFFIVFLNKATFFRKFKAHLKKQKILLAIGIIFALFILFVFQGWTKYFAAIIFIILPLLYTYLKSLESCMIKLKNPEELTEGDWLEGDVVVGKTIIKKSVHGLSSKEIGLLKRHRKRVYIREGIPFVPAFLLTFLLMVFFWAVLGESFDLFSLSSLFLF